MKILNCLILLSVLTPAQIPMKAQVSSQTLPMKGFANWMDAGSFLPASYTKEAWITLDTDAGTPNPILSSREVSGGHLLWAPSEFGYRLAAGHDGRWDAVIDPEALGLGWHHVAVTYDHRTYEMKLYKNGKMVAQRAGVVPATDSSLQAGAAPFLSHFQGTIDEIRIWKYPRSPKQINQAMKEVLTGEESGLIAYHRFHSSPFTSDHSTIQTDATLCTQASVPACKLSNWDARQTLYPSPHSGFNWGQEFVSCEPIILQQIYLKLGQESQGNAYAIHLFEGNAEEVSGQVPVASSYYTTDDGRFMFRHVQLQANQPYTFLIEAVSTSSPSYLASEEDQYPGGNLVSFQTAQPSDNRKWTDLKIQRFIDLDLCFMINPAINQAMDRSRPRLPVHARSVDPHHRVASLAASQNSSRGAKSPKKYHSQVPVSMGITHPRLIGEMRAINPRR